MSAKIIENMSNAEYHASPALGSSGVNEILNRSPAHYWAKYLDPKREQRTETPSMRIGSAIHTAVLEPDQFFQRYVATPVDAPKKPTLAQLNAKKPSEDSVASIDWWNNFNTVNAGKIVLTEDEFETCCHIADRVRINPASSTLFEAGRAEVSVFWTDEETGVECKCRFDWLPNDLKMIVDLKSTEDASMRAFQRSIVNYGYHRQAAWYSAGYTAAFGELPEGFIFAAFEKAAPYACGFYTPAPGMIFQGTRDVRSALASVAAARAAGIWPAYSESVLEIDLPKWAKTETETKEPEEY